MLIEFFTGTEKERVAQETIARLTGRQEVNGRLSTQNRRILGNARRLTRRLLLRRVGNGAALALLAVGAPTLYQATQPESDEQTYQRYLGAFEEVAQGDELAQTLLQLARGKRKRAVVRGNNIMADEDGVVGEHFYSVVYSKGEEVWGPGGIPGFSGVKREASAPYLMLKKVKVHPTWAGAVFGHEMLHVSHLLTGLENRADGFVLGEQEAYDLEFRLLDRATQGRFRQTIAEIATEIPQNAVMNRLTSDKFANLNNLFGPVRSNEEDGARYPAYLLAINFAVLEASATSPEIAKRDKVELIRGMFQKRIQFVR